MEQATSPNRQIAPSEKIAQQFKRSNASSSIKRVSVLQNLTALIKNDEEIENPVQIQDNEIEIEELFFHEDGAQNKKEYQSISLINLEEEQLKTYIADWNWTVFIEFVIYHFLYLIVLGPISNIIFLKGGKILMRNLKFWGLNSSFFTQTLQWVCCLFGLTFYIVQNNSQITLSEILLVTLALFQRCVVIGAKYATLTKERIELYRNQILPENVFNFDLTLNEWRFQTPKIMFLEIYRSLRRHEYEQTLFYFEFIVNPGQETIDAINKTQIDYILKFELQQAVQQCKLKDKKYKIFCGYKVMGYMIQEFQKQSYQGLMITIVTLQSFIIALTPIFYKIDQFIQVQPSPVDLIRIIINSLNSFIAFWGSYIFLFTAILDFQRKLFLLNQCQLMIMTKKSSNGEKKLLPTISLHNPQTVHAWSMLRSICLDYGQQFNLRSQGFYSLVFIGCIVLLVIWLGIILNLIIFQLFELILISQLTIILFGYILVYLYYGASVNNKLEEFEALLEDIKTIYGDVKNMKEQYFKNGKQPENKLHRKFVQKVKQYVNDQNLEEVEEYLNIIISTLKDSIRSLQYDLRNNPFKLYGVKVTFNLLKSIGVGISTVLGYAVQQRFQNFKKQQ